MTAHDKDMAEIRDLIKRGKRLNTRIRIQLRELVALQAISKETLAGLKRDRKRPK